MLEAQEDVFYYITTMNENYAQPPLPMGREDGIKRGMYLLRVSAVAHRNRTWVPGHYVTLGTDDFGHSDALANLGAYCGVDRHNICATALATVLAGFANGPTAGLIPYSAR